MKSLVNLYCIGCVTLATLVTCETAGATTIYDNSALGSDLAQGYSTTNEFGDQIILDTSTGERIITEFSFEYFGVGASANAQVTLRFYLNDALNGEGFWGPGTLLWSDTSDPLVGIPPTGRATLWWQPNVFIPANEFTWTVEFTGLSIAGGTWGLDIYDPPTVGNNYDDYWEHDALGNWLLKTNKFNVPMNFAARAEAVPEPHAAVLGLAGALAIFVFRAKLRKS
jgi:hypothetical protein